MATKLKPVDVVTIGVGWAGTILAKELAKAGLTVVGLERGGDRRQDIFQLPETKYDQLKYDRRLELFDDLSLSTITARNRTDEVARPMRRHGPFPWGEGLGGGGFHWAGWTWRHTPWDFGIRSHIIERYGERAIPRKSRPSRIGRSLTTNSNPITTSSSTPPAFPGKPATCAGRSSLAATHSKGRARANTRIRRCNEPMARHYSQGRRRNSVIIPSRCRPRSQATPIPTPTAPSSMRACTAAFA